MALKFVFTSCERINNIHMTIGLYHYIHTHGYIQLHLFLKLKLAFRHFRSSQSALSVGTALTFSIMMNAILLLATLWHQKHIHNI